MQTAKAATQLCHRQVKSTLRASFDPFGERARMVRWPAALEGFAIDHSDINDLNICWRLDLTEFIKKLTLQRHLFCDAFKSSPRPSLPQRPRW
jgi:hypothetical protein